jgi:NADP-dependent 3-hydroxy acid dehydrogenase YdfG
LPGPLVVIAGASSGIGLALAHVFAKEGNALLLIARHMKPVDGLPADRTEYAEADVADYPALERAIRGAEQKFGKTACLINSAGMADARAFTDVEPEAFSHEIDVNLKGTLNATKVVIGDMQAAKSGTIINISTVSDRKTSPVAVGYTASKYAVRAAGESLREAVGMQGVRVINMAPAATSSWHRRAQAFKESWARRRDRISSDRRSGTAARRAAPCRGTARPVRPEGWSWRSRCRRSRGGNGRAT